ncbi:MAG: hypothetical protein WBX22_30710 [Silvibacterium sp.]
MRLGRTCQLTGTRRGLHPAAEIALYIASLVDYGEDVEKSGLIGSALAEVSVHSLYKDVFVSEDASQQCIQSFDPLRMSQWRILMNALC